MSLEISGEAARPACPAHDAREAVRLSAWCHRGNQETDRRTGRGARQCEWTLSLAHTRPLRQTHCESVIRRYKGPLSGSGWCSLSAGAVLIMMMMEGQCSRCKIVVVGDTQCGKTALLHVFAKDSYPEVNRSIIYH